MDRVTLQSERQRTAKTKRVEHEQVIASDAAFASSFTGPQLTGFFLLRAHEIVHKIKGNLRTTELMFSLTKT